MPGRLTVAGEMGKGATSRPPRRAGMITATEARLDDLCQGVGLRA